MKIYLYTPYLFIAKMKPRGEPASNKKWEINAKIKDKNWNRKTN
jgi:hypothetical protein